MRALSEAAIFDSSLSHFASMRLRSSTLAAVGKKVAHRQNIQSCVESPLHSSIHSDFSIHSFNFVSAAFHSIHPSFASDGSSSGPALAATASPTLHSKLRLTGPARPPLIMAQVTQLRLTGPARPLLIMAQVTKSGSRETKSCYV